MACKTPAQLESQRRYREANRERLREWNREYARNKRRAEGQAIRGSAEWLAKRGPDHYLKGPAHPNWKGDAVGYFALHAWIDRHKERTGTCQECGVTPEPKKRTVATEWANISGAYRRDLDDYLELCFSCHRKRDMTDERRANVTAANRRRAAAGRCQT